MHFEEFIASLSERMLNHADRMLTEEAVKTAVVLPFLNGLGYDVFNPREVIPEYTADAVGKKGEKVDYAVCINDEIKILVECKPITVELSKVHLSQLYRYFSVTDAKFAILTNGRYFHFHTDIEERNKLDTRPFLVFDLGQPSERLIPELKKFAKAEFNVEGILDSAERLKYISYIKSQINALMDDPSEDFVRMVCCDAYEGRFTSAVRERFTPLVRAAFRELFRDLVQSRLSSALQNASDDASDAPAAAAIPEDEIVTTHDEIEGFMIVKSIARSAISASRIYIRDQKSYCGVLVDNNNRKPIIRLHFNGKTKAVSFFDTEKEERIRIEALDDLFDYSDRILATVSKYVEATP
ncbi:restriction endonuclease or methylase [Stappia sp. 22II-S9-Z10]|nr:restriction endonuclease or methylase [Stappia sp. 22II-S9-Z10]